MLVFIQLLTLSNGTFCDDGDCTVVQARMRMGRVDLNSKRRFWTFIKSFKGHHGSTLLSQLLGRWREED
jgi:hypothetical protein